MQERLNLTRWQNLEQEKLPEVYHDVVRVITLQMAPPDRIDPQLFSTTVQEDGRIALASPMPQTTVSIWEQKAGKSENPNQVILPGGKMRVPEDDPTITPELVEDQARHELWTELHLTPSRVSVLEDSVRHYDFIHRHLVTGHNQTKKPGRLFNTVHKAVAVASPFDDPGYFDPRDKLQAAIPLLPDELHAFLEQEFIDLPNGTRGHLYDSLSHNQELRHASHMHTDGKEVATKGSIEEQAFIYEAIIQRQVINRVLNITCARLSDPMIRTLDVLHALPDPRTMDDAKKIMQKVHYLARHIESKYSVSEVRDQNLDSVNPDSRAMLETQGITTEQIQRRMLLASEMKTALQQVAFAQIAEVSKQTGPQEPFILAQVLLKLETLSPYEYRLIKQCAPLRHIIDTMCEVFVIDPTTNGWYEALHESLKDFQENSNGDIHDALIHRFCHPTDDRLTPIREKNLLGELSQLENEFVRYVAAPVEHIADRALLDAVLPDLLGSGTSELPELLIRAFAGVEQYKGQPISRAEQYASLRKIVDILDIHEHKRILSEQMSRHIKPLRAAIYTMFGQKIGTRNTTLGAFARYKIQPDFIAKYKNQLTEDTEVFGIDFSAITSDVLFDIREKDFMSSHRKRLERGGVDPEIEEISDQIGFLCAFDEQKFKEEIIQHNPHLKGEHTMVKELTSKWSRWTMQLILQGMISEIMESREQYNPKLRLYKGRWAPKYQHIITSLSIPIEPQEEGSAASDAKWNWVKFAYVLQDRTGEFTAEFQAFPTIDIDLMGKKDDDPRYWEERTFKQPPGFRWPLSKIYLNFHEAYDELMRRLYGKDYQPDVIQDGLLQRLISILKRRKQLED